MDHKKYSGIGFLSGSPRTSCMWVRKYNNAAILRTIINLDKARDEETNRFKALHCLATPVLTRQPDVRRNFPGNKMWEEEVIFLRDLGGHKEFSLQARNSPNNSIRAHTLRHYVHVQALV